jgi:phage-related baseplate assembly protein
MGGRTSIKVVLPSVLSATKSPKIIDWLAQENLYAETESGMLDPYLLLEKKIFNEANEYHAKVKNGSDAMIAYREMLYGESRNDQNAKDALNDALKKYCKLDTLAMLIIWEHWQDMIKTQNLTTRANLIDGLVS